MAGRSTHPVSVTVRGSTQKYTRDRAEVLLPYPQVVHNMRGNGFNSVEEMLSFPRFCGGVKAESILFPKGGQGSCTKCKRPIRKSLSGRPCGSPRPAESRSRTWHGSWAFPTRPSISGARHWPSTALKPFQAVGTRPRWRKKIADSHEN